MEKKARHLAAMIEGDPLRIVLEFVPGASLRAVSKTFALHAPRVTALVFRGRQDGDALPLAFYPGIVRIGRDLVRLDLRQIAIESFDFLGGLALKELYLEGSVGTAVINSDSLEVLDMSDTEFRLGRLPKLLKATTRECPNSQVFPPSLTSLNCSYTRAPLWVRGLLLTKLDMSGLSLNSLQFLRDMPLKELFLTSCTWQDHDEPWPLNAALLPLCVKLSVSHTTIYPEGTFAKLEVFEMQQCPNIENVPDAPLTALNCSDNYLTEEFIEALKGLPMLTELKAAGCNEEEELDLSGLDKLEYLAVPDTRLFGEPPLYGFAPNIRVVRFSEQDIEEFDERVLGLPDHTKVYVHGFDVFDFEYPEESGLEGAWKTVETVSVQELRVR